MAGKLTLPRALAASVAVVMVTAAMASAAAVGTIVEANTPRGDSKNLRGEAFLLQHMASEHHTNLFDLGAFFALHDYDRNGVLDRSEIEAIYGVHHSTSVKHSANAEVHDEKADKIVLKVLERIDTNKDGLITTSEFIAAGIEGLPNFPEFGAGTLGHHYDEESEYFVHHEEMHHNTPETQTDEAYNHPEDIKHFAHHADIEAEEERRERAAMGMISAEEDEKRRKAAEARGEEYKSPYEAQAPKEGSVTAPQRAYDAHAADGYAETEARASTHHVFRTPKGPHVVVSDPVQAKEVEKAALEHEETPERQPGETAEGYHERLKAYAERRLAAEKWKAQNPDLASTLAGKTESDNAVLAAARVAEEEIRAKKTGIDPVTGEVIRKKGESTEDFLKRKSQKRFDDLKRMASYGAVPSDRDQARKGAPFKSRLKKTGYFGEF